LVVNNDGMVLQWFSTFVVFLFGSDYSREVGARDLSFGIFENLILIMVPINGVGTQTKE